MKNFELATFAGGCFWCMVSPFDRLPGVVKVVSGYTGGEKANPTYEEVCTLETGHFEAVQITFDPEKVTYGQLLAMFWRQIDPTDPGGQFFDRGDSYCTAIFYHSEEQKKEAEASLKALAASQKFGGQPITTRIIAAGPFYAAEEYHQDFYQKNPTHYGRYRQGSGRDAFLKKYWQEEKPQ